jgi:hypothetical protein
MDASGGTLLDLRAEESHSGSHAAYLSNGVVQVKINPNTGLQVYAPDGQVWGDEYITEKVETKGGSSPGWLRRAGALGRGDSPVGTPCSSTAAVAGRSHPRPGRVSR